MKNKRRFPWTWMLVLLLVAACVLWPLIPKGFYVTDDGEWMVIRLSAFYQSLAEGQFPVRLLGRLNNSYGYPVANFLYPGFLYIGSVLHVVGLTFVDSVKVILAGSVLGTGIFLFLFLLHWFEVIPSVIGVITFLGSPYLLYDLYRRGSVGEVLAFFPAAIMLYSIAASKYWLLSLATAFLIISHNSLALLLGCAIGIYALSQENKLKVFWSAMYGVGLSAFFWIPALFERTFVKFDATTISDPAQYFIGSHNSLLLGIPVILALIVSVWAYANQKREVSIFSGIVMIGYFFSLPISQGFWQIEVFAKIIQFPYRFLSIPVLFGPWIVSYVCSRFSGIKRTISISLFVLVWVYTVYLGTTSIVFVDRPDGYYTTNEGTTTVHDEYLPKWVTHVPLYRAPNVFDFISGDATMTVNSVSTQLLDVSVIAKQKSLLRINKLYYPGWGVTIDGVLTPINYQSGDGMMRVDVPEGTHRIIVNFRETIFRFIADAISGIFGILYLWSIRRQKHQ